MLNNPVISEGSGLTVIAFVREQPIPIVYEIVNVPAATPVTTPSVSTVPIAMSLLLHVPPVVIVANVVVLPRHTVDAPVIVAGNWFTVTSLVISQPELILYVIVAIPSETPVHIPVDDTIVATAALLLVHVPPVGVAVNVPVLPTHTAVAPLMLSVDVPKVILRTTWLLVSDI
jgi:hypothetical protein